MKTKPYELCGFRPFGIMEDLNLSGAEFRPLDGVRFVKFSVIEDVDFNEVGNRKLKNVSVST